VDIFEEFKAKYGDEAVSLLKSKLPEWGVPKDQYKAKTDELKTAAAELTTARQQMEQTQGKLTELEKVAGDANALKESFEKIRGEYDEYKNGEQTRLTELQLKMKSESALIAAGANPDAVEFLAGMIDVKKMSLTADGKLDGFESQLEALKGSKKGLFATVISNSPEPQGGGDAPDALMAKIQAKFNS
jgi:chromosome segregation ATPase